MPEVMVVDNGLFVELAVRLQRELGEVGYSSRWKSAFPKSASTLIGRGLAGILRVDEFWDELKNYDTFVFPDVYDADLQIHLEAIGKQVWGSRRGDWLELDRWRLREWLKEQGLRVAMTREVIGLENLRLALADLKNVWVKTSRMRGDFETFHHRSPRSTQPWLDELAHRLGAAQHQKVFIIEDDIPGIEIGMDTISIDGEFPQTLGWGLEIKDTGYLGCVVPESRLPEPLKIVRDKIASELKAMRYRNGIATEVRVTQEGEFYFTDPCQRFGSPPSEIMWELYSNWPEVILAGARGKLIEPKPIAKVGGMLMLHSIWADKNWMPIEFPDELRQWVKLRNCTKIKDEYYVVPQEVGLPEVGAVVAVGDSVDEVCELLNQRANIVSGYQLDVMRDAMDKARQDIDELKGMGIDFGC